MCPDATPGSNPTLPLPVSEPREAAHACLSQEVTETKGHARPNRRQPGKTQVLLTQPARNQLHAPRTSYPD